jgi:hypothetical protein
MSDDLDRDLKARFDRELAHVRAPATWSIGRRHSSALAVATSVAVALALLVGATAAGLALRADRESRSGAAPSASPSASPSPSPTVSPGGSAPSSPAPTATAGAASGWARHESPILGYRVDLPAGYRRVSSSFVTANEALAIDRYTVLTEAQEREECDTDTGDLPPRSMAAYLNMHAYRNPGGLSAAQWATASPRSTHHTVEPVTIDGREAARLVQQGQVSAYVFAANERIYLLSPDTWPTDHPLAEIAASFRPITPSPVPSATPTAAPAATREAAREMARRLAQAFAARDADAIARLITTACSIGVWAVVEPPQPGVDSCCILNRAVRPFLQALREHFASGLTVTVDPDVQVEVEGQGATSSERLFVRSDWREADRTLRIDLFLREMEGEWRWVQARHHYPRAVIGSCAMYRSPWGPRVSSC